MDTAAISVTGISKKYSNNISVLDGLSYSFEKNRFYAVTGPSGSGKTTLLQILGTILKATSGEIKINGELIDNMNDEQKSHLRRDRIGFIFQDFMLNPYLKAYENVMLPMLIKKDLKLPQMKSEAIEVLDNLGLAARAEHFPNQLSGGEQQRVAIARALANEPDIILADEPTGALDSKSSTNLLEIFDGLNSGGQTILMVTHSSMAASYASRVIFIKDGELFSQIYKGDISRREFFDKIVSTLSVLSDGGVDIG